MPDLLASFTGGSAAVMLKFLVAAAGAALLAVRLASGRRPPNPRRRRLEDAALALLAVMAFAGWWNFGRFHAGTYTHPHEFFHYYLGAKYSGELGYTGLYDCTAAVEAEEGRTPDLARRWIRDLRTNQVIAGSPAAADPTLCRSRFTPARWREFSRDVRFFRGRVGTRKWQTMQTDHGYNATPVWTITGKLLASTGPITARKMLALALIDPLLIVVMWAVVWWAFGWRTLAIAVLWWGTNYPARYNYIGGAFLRADWLLLAIGAIALARRGLIGAGGGALGASALLRIFPGFVASGPALQAVWALKDAADRRRLRPLLRLAAGGVLAVLLLIPLSWMVVDGGVGPGVARWQSFAENSRKHLSGTATNRISLKTAISYDADNSLDELRDFWLDGPGDAWQTARRQSFEARRWLYYPLVLIFVGLLAFAVRGQPLWAAMVLGIGLIPVAADITCYYYGILLAYAFLTPERPWIGVALLTLSALTCLAPAIWPAEEVHYAAMSVMVVVFVVMVTAVFAAVPRPPVGPPRDDEGSREKSAYGQPSDPAELAATPSRKPEKP